MMRAALLFLLGTIAWSQVPTASVSDDLLRQERAVVQLINTATAEYAYWNNRYPTWQELIDSGYLAEQAKKPKFAEIASVVRMRNAESFFPGHQIRIKLADDRLHYALTVSRVSTEGSRLFCSERIWHSNDQGLLAIAYPRGCGLMVAADRQPSHTNASNTLLWVKPNLR